METEQKKTPEEVLHDLLMEDRKRLLDHENLIKQLGELVPAEYTRDLKPIESALQHGIGETFLAADESNDPEKRNEAVDRARELLQSTAMQEKRIDYVVETLKKAIDKIKKP